MEELSCMSCKKKTPCKFMYDDEHIVNNKKAIYGKYNCTVCQKNVSKRRSNDYIPTTIRTTVQNTVEGTVPIEKPKKTTKGR